METLYEDLQFDVEYIERATYRTWQAKSQLSSVENQPNKIWGADVAVSAPTYLSYFLVVISDKDKGHTSSLRSDIISCLSGYYGDCICKV